MTPLAQRLGLTSRTVFGGVGQGPQVSAIRRGVDVVVACPGRLEDLIGQGHVSLDAVEVTVIDEADHMADLGFLPQVRRLLDATPRSRASGCCSPPPSTAASASSPSGTCTSPVTHEADSAQSPISTMSHHVLHVTTDGHLPVLLDLVAAPGRTVVFTRTKHRAKKIARQLNGSGVPAVELHGNLSQNARTRTMDAFHSGAARTLVATDIAARGIHVDDVALVIHADPPVDQKAYTHRSGRTARAGASGTVITLMTDDQVRDVRDLTRKAGVRATTTRVTSTHPLLQELAPGERSFEGGLVVPESTSSARQGGGSGDGGRRRGGPRTGSGSGAVAAPRLAVLRAATASAAPVATVARPPARHPRVRPARPPRSPRVRVAAPADRRPRARTVAGYGRLRHELVRAGVVPGGARAGCRPVRRTARGLVLVAALVAVAVEPPWRVLRLGVTLVHELGHAGVGVLSGRRFTGFVLRGDMSGSAVTVGPARGLGRVLTTWAGYPAPAVVGALVVWLAVRGWSAPVLTGILAVLVVAALRVRSGLTALVVLVAAVGAGALWWAGRRRSRRRSSWRWDSYSSSAPGATSVPSSPHRTPRSATPACWPGSPGCHGWSGTRRSSSCWRRPRGWSARPCSTRPACSAEAPTGVGSGTTTRSPGGTTVPGRTSYTSDEVESCRDSCDALLAAWAANDIEDTTLEAMVFGQAVVVLHTWFAHRDRDLERADGNPIHEVRVVADSVVGNDGILRVEGPSGWDPSHTVLRLAVGDDIELTANRFERLAAAYLAAIETTYPESAG